jgi:hypothetical protein
LLHTNTATGFTSGTSEKSLHACITCIFVIVVGLDLYVTSHPLADGMNPEGYISRLMQVEGVLTISTSEVDGNSPPLKKRSNAASVGAKMTRGEILWYKGPGEPVEFMTR